MSITLTMPALSPTMSEGVIARWVKREGDRVEPGEVVAEIETDKATVEFEAVDEGVLGKILVPEGGSAKVGEPIAILLEEGEGEEALAKALAGLTDTGEAAAPAPAPTAAEAAASAPQPTTAATTAPTPASAPATAATVAAPPPSSPATAAAPAASGEQPDGARIFASPLARRMAKEAGIDLRTLRGSGPHGRIVRADVERAIAEARRAKAAPAAAAEAPAAPAAPAPAPAVPDWLLQPSPGMAYEEVPLSHMRRTIARRLSEAKAFVPHFYLTLDCNLERLLTMRAELNQRLGQDGRISVNDFLIKAAALAIRRVPDVNASFGGDRLYRYKTIDISVAVAVPGGLVTPVVRRADEKGLATIAREMRDYVARAREGRLKPEEYTGGSFSLSNLGMYGIREFAAILNPPQACILAVGAAEKRPVVREDQVVVETRMTVTLSCDHRVVDGALGAEFLQAFKAIVEDPLQLLL